MRCGGNSLASLSQLAVVPAAAAYSLDPCVGAAHSSQVAYVAHS